MFLLTHAVLVLVESHPAGLSAAYRWRELLKFCLEFTIKSNVEWIFCSKYLLLWDFESLTEVSKLCYVIFFAIHLTIYLSLCVHFCVELSEAHTKVVK
jgi:hypothetical protein